MEKQFLSMFLNTRKIDISLTKRSFFFDFPQNDTVLILSSLTLPVCKNYRLVAISSTFVIFAYIHLRFYICNGNF